MIDKKTVEDLATLARIKLTPEEVERLEKDLQKILAYVDDLKAVKTDGLPEVSQVTGLKNVLREDVSEDIAGLNADKSGQYEETRQRLIEAFPQKENGFLKVKAVFTEQDE